MNKPAYAAIQVRRRSCRSRCGRRRRRRRRESAPWSQPASRRQAQRAPRHFVPSLFPTHPNPCHPPPSLSPQVHSPLKPVLVFVSSRRQTRLTALDLITYAAADERPEQWLQMEPQEIQVRVCV